MLLATFGKICSYEVGFLDCIAVYLTPVAALPAALHTLNNTTVLSPPSPTGSFSNSGTKYTSMPSSLRY